MATNFGVANDYNLFVLGNASMTDSDVEGRLAVQGDIMLSGYSVSSEIEPNSSNTNTLVIGGRINIMNSQNFAGDTVVASINDSDTYDMSNPNGRLIIGTPIDFDEQDIFLKCLSREINKLTANGIVSTCYGNEVYLIGEDEELNVFKFDSQNIAGSGIKLSEISELNIKIPEGSFAIINILGSPIIMQNFETFVNGYAATRDDAARIVFNFPEATSWESTAVGIFGSVLAPYAAAVATNHQFNGNVIFGSITGNAEFHNVTFEGVLPETICRVGPVDCLCKNNCCCELQNYYAEVSVYFQEKQLYFQEKNDYFDRRYGAILASGLTCCDQACGGTASEQSIQSAFPVTAALDPAPAQVLQVDCTCKNNCCCELQNYYAERAVYFQEKQVYFQEKNTYFDGRYGAILDSDLTCCDQACGGEV